MFVGLAILKGGSYAHNLRKLVIAIAILTVESKHTRGTGLCCAKVLA
jgi:hypothetical protein